MGKTWLRRRWEERRELEASWARELERRRRPWTPAEIELEKAVDARLFARLEKHKQLFSLE